MGCLPVSTSLSSLVLPYVPYERKKISTTVQPEMPDTYVVVPYVFQQ